MTDDLTTTWTELPPDTRGRIKAAIPVTGGGLPPQVQREAIMRAIEPVISSALKAHTDEAVEAALVAAADDLQAKHPRDVRAITWLRDRAAAQSATEKDGSCGCYTAREHDRRGCEESR